MSIRVEEFTFDQGAWNGLIDLVNDCQQLSFLYLRYCDITQYDCNEWKGMRPIYFIVISNCNDADGRFCDQWKGSGDAMKNLFLPLSERACHITVMHQNSNIYSTGFTMTVDMEKYNDRHSHISVYSPFSLTDVEL